MISVLQSAIILVTLFIMEIFYFKIASHFNIIDKPNVRSSHSSITLRGGGVIFTLGILLWFIFYGCKFPYFFLGLLLITLISFFDDVLTLNNRIRIVIHFSSVILMFFQWNLFGLPWYWLIISLVFVIATINAYNFMDGINGITGSYSFLCIATLYYINDTIVNFTNADLLKVVGLSLIVFNFYNFRKKAKCFAGDVGSVSIAFTLIFLIGQLILTTHNFGYILLLLMYGVDTFTTVCFRKLRKENIFKAHRSHFYQYLANQSKWNHLVVATLYCALQLVFNLAFLFLFKDNLILALLFACLVLVAFLIARFFVEGRTYLLKAHLNS